MMKALIRNVIAGIRNLSFSARSTLRTPTLDLVLGAARIVFIPETNVFCEFKNPEEIPWREICPNADEIHLIVPMAVVEEMDKHKRSDGRLRRRALWFNDLMRKIEDNGGASIELRTTGPRVTMEIAPHINKRDLDSARFELEDSDGRILAETAHIVKRHSEAIFLSDDGKPLQIARSVGLLHVRPPTTWRRSEPPDERDRDILRLREQLGAKPVLAARAAPEFLTEERFRFETVATGATPVELASAIRRHIFASYPRLSDDELERCAASFSLGSFVSGSGTGAIERYKERYREFEQRVSEFAETFMKRIEDTAWLLPLRFELENTGTATAEDVQFELELCGPLEFFPITQAGLHFGAPPDAPDAPSPVTDVLWSSLYAAPQSERDPFELEQVTWPSLDGGTKRLVWRCQQFRHGDMFKPYCIASPADGKKIGDGAVKLTARAANIAQANSATVPIRISESPTDLSSAFLRRRAILVSDNVYEPILAAIEQYG